MRMKNYFIRTGIRLVSNLSKSIGQYANVAIGSEVSFVKKCGLLLHQKKNKK